MNKIVLPILIITCCMISCSNRNATSWNTNMIETYNKIVDDIDDFQELISLETIGDSTINRHITDVGNNALTNIDKAIKDFSEREAPSNGEECNKAAIEMFQSAKEQLNIGLKFILFTEKASEADVDGYAEEYDAASANTSEKVNIFLKEHKQFVKSEGIDEE